MAPPPNQFMKDGYLDANGNFTATPLHTADGTRYQVSADTGVNPPRVDYHDYPARTGGQTWWNRYGSDIWRNNQNLPGPTNR